MSHPLLCWDIIQEGLSRRSNFAEDINALNYLARLNAWDFVPEKGLVNSIIWENKTIIVTSTDIRIVFATKNMYQMNGYKPSEVIGQSPKMFQGKQTAAAQKHLIGTAIKSLKTFDATVINYRKDGSIYHCHIEGYPVFNNRKQLVNFIALENVIN